MFSQRLLGFACFSFFFFLLGRGLSLSLPPNNQTHQVQFECYKEKEIRDLLSDDDVTFVLFFLS